MLLKSRWISTPLITKCCYQTETPGCRSLKYPRSTAPTLSASPTVPKCWASSASRGASTTGKWNCNGTTSAASASATGAWTGRGRTAAWGGTAAPGALSGLIPRFQPGIMISKNVCLTPRPPRLVCCSIMREDSLFSWVLARNIT